MAIVGELVDQAVAQDSLIGGCFFRHIHAGVKKPEEAGGLGRPGHIDWQGTICLQGLSAAAEFPGKAHIHPRKPKAHADGSRCPHTQEYRSQRDGSSVFDPVGVHCRLPVLQIFLVLLLLLFQWEGGVRFADG